MKKLLVLVAVLAMASLANASLTLSISNLTPAVGGNVNITVATAGETADFLMYLDLTGGQFVAGPMTAGAAIGDLGGIVGPYDITDGKEYEITRAQSSGAAANGTAGVANIQYLGGAVKVDLYDWRTQEIVGTATITPEPATLAVLGLGALMLRRKK